MLTAKEAKTQNVQRANNQKIIIDEIIKKQDGFLGYATQVAIEKGLTRASTNYQMGAGECKELNENDMDAFCAALQEYLEGFGYKVEAWTQPFFNQCNVSWDWADIKI